jgi:outer membrane protein assembly factor BamB
MLIAARALPWQAVAPLSRSPSGRVKTLSRIRYLAAAGTCLLLVACGGGLESAAPRVPGAGGRTSEDPAFAALDVKLVRYRELPPLDPARVIEQTTYRQDMAHTGAIPGATVGSQYSLAWELNGLNPGDHTAAKGSAVIVRTDAGPRIVVGGDSGFVFCLTPDGKLVWSAYTDASHRGIHGTPAVVDGIVYIGAYDGALYAFALDTGAFVFRTQIGGSIGSSPVVYDGKVYVSVETPKPSGILAILDARTGDILWRDDGLTNHPHSSVALDPGHDVMVVGDNSGALTAWDMRERRRRWVMETGGSIKGPILVHDGAAIFGSWDGNMYSVDLATGKPRWTRKVGKRVMSGAALSVDLGLVYMGCHNGRMYALDLATGAIVWVFKTGERILSSPVLATNRLLFGSSDSYFYIVDAATGELVYKFRARGTVSSSPALLGDRIVFTDRRTDDVPGSLYVLAPPADSH